MEKIGIEEYTNRLLNMESAINTTIYYIYYIYVWLFALKWIAKGSKGFASGGELIFMELCNFERKF